jgi:hypothetical protein
LTTGTGKKEDEREEGGGRAFGGLDDEEDLFKIDDRVDWVLLT